MKWYQMLCYKITKHRWARSIGTNFDGMPFELPQELYKCRICGCGYWKDISTSIGGQGR